MPKYQYSDVIRIAKYGSDEEWTLCVKYIQHTEADSDEMKGLLEFLERYQYRRQELLHFIADIEERKPEIKATKLRHVPAWVPLAAASCILIAMVLVNRFYHANDIHATEQALPIYMDADNNLLFNKAMSQYKKEDFQAAAASFAQLTGDTALYFQGVSLELAGKYEESNRVLQQLPPTSTYFNNALLHRAANLIELKQEKDAQFLLMDFAPQNSAQADLVTQLKLRIN